MWNVKKDDLNCFYCYTYLVITLNEKGDFKRVEFEKKRIGIVNGMQ